MTIASAIWSVCLIREKVYPSRIANVNELEMRLIYEWERFDQSIVDAAIAAGSRTFPPDFCPRRKM